MGHKNSKGNISITEYKGRIRLRWRFQSKRFSLNLSVYSKAAILPAKKLALEIEQDMLNNLFDISLKNIKESF
jgi:integrase